MDEVQLLLTGGNIDEYLFLLPLWYDNNYWLAPVNMFTNKVYGHLNWIIAWNGQLLVF